MSNLLVAITIFSCITITAIILDYKSDTKQEQIIKLQSEIRAYHDQVEILLDNNSRIVNEYKRDVGKCMDQLRYVTGDNYMFTGIGSNNLFIKSK